MKNVVIAGATGAVGNEFLKLLEAREFPVKNLRLLASARSIGKKLEFLGEKIREKVLKKFNIFLEWEIKIIGERS